MSSEPTISEINEAIALFMGGSSIKKHGCKRYVYYPNSCAKDVAELKYHESWDALMPVVEKIESLFNGDAFTVTIKGEWCLIDQNTQHWMAYREIIDLKNIEVKRNNKRESAYYAVYQFIQWYNQSTTNNDTTEGK